MPKSIKETTLEDFLSRKFDFVVIGGGTAGLAVATRLAENVNVTVGVLESGSSALGEDKIDIPGNFGQTIGSKYDWQFETVPQTGLGGRKLDWARGRVLGGTSALNFMSWNRPSKEDLDAWEALGNVGWGWNDLLPYYMKSEAFHPPSPENQKENKLFYDESVLGTSGPVQIAYAKQYSASHRVWHDTLNSLGIKTNTAHLAGSNVGVWTDMVSVDPESQTRSYSLTAYYNPHLQRENIVVLTGASAKEVVLEKDESGDSWVARGIRFGHGNEEYTVSVSCEAILSAGTIQSPQLLELSGVGNPDILSAAGIQVKVANANVGENLQDHLMLATIYEVDPTLENPDDLKNEEVAAAAREQYAKSKSGPLTALAVSFCYLHSSQIVNEDTYELLSTEVNQLAAADSEADMAILKSRFSVPPLLGQVEFVFDLGNWNTNFTPDTGRKYGTCLIMLQYPFSRGNIHVNPSANGSPSSASDPPSINPKFFENQGKLDLDLMSHAVVFAHKISKTHPLATIVRRRVFPEVGADRCMNEVKEWVVQNAITDCHPVGTCAMGGHEGMKRGVVDERLRVYGVRGLRVVDASIMPLQIGAHLQATIYAIAEKGVAMILEDYAGI